MVKNASTFKHALYLFPTAAMVADYNATKLRANTQPVAAIEAIHSGPRASKIPASDAGGLEPIVYLAHGARVMLTANLWVQVGLVNGAMGSIVAICYDGEDQSPPSLPLAVTVHFDTYTGPTLSDGSVPIIPLRRTWLSSNHQCSRLQLPLKLAWAVTIHKSQGMTLDKVVIDVGKKEFSTGLTFVACSWVRHLNDLLFVPPFPFQRVAHLANSKRHKEWLAEDTRFQHLGQSSVSENIKPVSDTCVKTTIESSGDVADAETSSTKPNIPKTQSEEACINAAVINKSIPNSPNLPVSDAGVDNHDDEVAVTGVVSNSHCFMYYPGDEDWQHRQCDRLGLVYRRPNGVIPVSHAMLLTLPNTFHDICGDGNCLFWSFSLIITGSQEQHMLVRAAVVRHMREIAEVLWSHQIAPLLRHMRSIGEESHRVSSVSPDAEWTQGMEEYLAATQMEQDGTWGSEVEVMALTHLLDTLIYCYDTSHGWHLFTPGNIHGMFNLNQFATHQMAMYVRHYVNHYDVVRSVQ